MWQLQRTDVRRCGLPLPFIGDISTQASAEIPGNSFLCRSVIEGMMAILVKGDACQPDDVEKVFQDIDGVDAVVSTIGGTTADPLADSQVTFAC